MFGFFGREGKTAKERISENVRDNDEDEDDIELCDKAKKDDAAMERRLSALEDAEYARRRIDGGAAKIGANLVSRGGDTSLYAKMLDSYMFGLNSVVERMAGVMIGRPSDLRSGGGVRMSDAGAITLRDWLLKEFPLETPKPDDKKPGGKK